MSLDAPGLKYGRTKPSEERVIRNGWPANVFGRVLCFSDLGILEIASIEKNAQPHGAVLVLAEEEAGALKFGYTESFEREATPGQRATLETLASIDDESIPRRLKKRAESELPALFLADFAVVANGIYFRDGRRKQSFEHVLDYWSESMQAAEDEAHRHFNVGLRSHLQDQGFELSELPQAHLDDQQREAMRNDTAPEINELYARAQLLNRVELDTPQFVIVAARHAITALDQ